MRDHGRSWRQATVVGEALNFFPVLWCLRKCGNGLTELKSRRGGEGNVSNVQRKKGGGKEMKRKKAPEQLT
jgi:hypothetical protein